MHRYTFAHTPIGEGKEKRLISFQCPCNSFYCYCFVESIAYNAPKSLKKEVTGVKLQVIQLRGDCSPSFPTRTNSFSFCCISQRLGMPHEKRQTIFQKTDILSPE